MRFIFLFLFSTILWAQDYQFQGIATHKDKLIYTEYHTHTFKEGKPVKAETLYKNAKGELWASLKSDFRRSAFIPFYKFENFKSGEVIEVKAAEDESKFILSFKKNKETKPKTEEFSFSEKAVAGQGFNYFLVSKLDQMKKGDKFSRGFVIPARQSIIDFKYTVTDISDKKINIKANIDNFFLKMFVSNLYITYDKQTKRLLRYEGLSNIKDEDGDNYKVVITYQHP